MRQEDIAIEISWKNASRHREYYVTPCLFVASVARFPAEPDCTARYESCVRTRVRNARGMNAIFGRALHEYDVASFQVGSISRARNSKTRWRLRVYDTYVWFAVSPCPLDISSTRTRTHLRYRRNIVTGKRKRARIGVTARCLSPST